MSDGEPPDTPAGGAPGDEQSLVALLAFITESRSIDFTGYKRSSLTRRIAKRMNDVGVTTYDEYRDRLEANADEFSQLFDTVLINVTSFFRDPSAWEYLRSEVVPDLIEAAGDEEIRVWSAGCSSGEEAYSLAITFAEALGVERFRDQVKIYATDIDEDALRQARQGLYLPRALDTLSPELVDRYFEVAGSSFAFRPDLRRRVIFGRHDITHDAPISRLQLLTCRNTLMYFNAETQNMVLDRFHFAIDDDGVLFLGKAEMLLSNGHRFEAISMPHRVFRRRPGIRAYRASHVPVTLEPARGPGTSVRLRQLRDLALEANPVAHLIVDANGAVALVNNQARAMFGITSRDEGRPLRDLEVSYRPVELRSLIEQAHTERRVVRLNAVERALGPNDMQFLDVQVHPLITGDGIILGADVTFTDSTALVRVQEDAKRATQDFETTNEELQSTNEELETTNEELQSSIEELETTNEELQSTNEELETTNEELQSTNEELETMNEELRARTGELDEVSDFLRLILGSLRAGVVVLDPGLRVRTWNARAEDMWGLRADEVEGQPFFALDFGLPTVTLRDAVRMCLDDGQQREVAIDAMNRLGRPVVSTVVVTRLGTASQGIVLSMEERARG